MEMKLVLCQPKPNEIHFWQPKQCIESLSRRRKSVHVVFSSQFFVHIRRVLYVHTSYVLSPHPLFTSYGANSGNGVIFCNYFSVIFLIDIKNLADFD